MTAFALAGDGVGVGLAGAVCEQVGAADAAISNSSASVRGWSLRSKSVPFFIETYLLAESYRKIMRSILTAGER